MHAFEAYCLLCKKAIKLGTLGVRALSSHAKSEKHLTAVKGLEQTTAISQFCQASVGSTLPRQGPHCSSATPASDLRVAFGSEPTLRAEVLWVLHVVTRHQSYSANEEIGELFQTMFPDSDIAKSFRCGKDKTSYIARFGVADFIKRDLISKVTGPFVLMSKMKQLDLHVRFWESGQVQSRYLGSQFMGHATAEDLMKHVKECVDPLDLRNLVSISMDGPNVNFKCFELFQQELAGRYGGSQLVAVGSCGLHTLHNAVKSGFSIWQVEKLLRAMHTLFHNVPARREDYTAVTKSIIFPLSFCGHRWLENQPVIERALEVWPSLTKYIDAVRRKQLPNPGTASFDTVEDAMKDTLTEAKLHFSLTVARLFSPFLKKYQTDEPVMPFLSNDLAELIKSLLRRFVRRDILQDITTLQLTKLDVADKNNWLQPKDIDIGLGAESVLKSRTIVELRVLEFKRDCTQGLSNIVRKIQEKSPLKYATVRQMGCLNPSVMFRDPDKCKRQMKCLVQTFLQDKQLKGGVSAGRNSSE
ncbi:uncharacterized protein LOC127170690 isoform X1 [Labeo rohita]|uniref:uncharacterized protein LOC127170690 isoform X1 n=1 Tax=Labeo rohita TaxID=84645 RepID=UPI0021E2DA9D|nr:uncharacterized protein LOC127170690 isoform X1 [Labeo rohita]